MAAIWVEERGRQLEHARLHLIPDMRELLRDVIVLGGIGLDCKKASRLRLSAKSDWGDVALTVEEAAGARVGRLAAVAAGHHAPHSPGLLHPRGI